MDREKFIKEALDRAFEEEKKEIKSADEIKQEEEEFKKEEKDLQDMLSELE